MYWDSVKSEWEKEKQQILSVLTESSDELLDISLPIAEVFTILILIVKSISMILLTDDFRRNAPNFI